MMEKKTKQNNLHYFKLDLDKIIIQYPYKIPLGLSTLYNSPSVLGPLSQGIGIDIDIDSSLAKNPVNFALLKRENIEINKCELLKQQIKECMQTEYSCNHFFESYLTQCTL